MQEITNLNLHYSKRSSSDKFDESSLPHKCCWDEIQYHSGNGGQGPTCPNGEVKLRFDMHRFQSLK